MSSCAARACGIAVTLGLLAAACSSSDDATDDGETPVVNSECRNIGPVHRSPQCDGCTRDLCCPEVQGCEASTLCSALIHCLAKCERGDTRCSRACKGGGGETELAVVNGCAEKACPVACGTAFIVEGG